MSKCSTRGYAKSGQISKEVPNANHVSLKAQNRVLKETHGLGNVTTLSQKPRERPLSTVSTSDVTPHSPQRRWSADYSKRVTSPVIIVKKNKKEPQAPQRSVSLIHPYTASHSASKRYSCPPIGIFTSPGQSSSSSSSSSTTSSCSSPPPVQTSVITGPDPLGWKLRPKSSSTSARARANRLSLQIPLPVIPVPNPDPPPKTKPAVRPKPFRRHHSDSSTFLRSLETPLTFVTREELCAVHLRSVTLSDESDDVFRKGTQEEKRVTTQPSKIPPPVMEKTSMARQTAQLIAQSHQRCRPVTAKSNNEENICNSVIKLKPKYSHQAVDHKSIHPTKTAGLHFDIRCDRGRSAPHFPA